MQANGKPLPPHIPPIPPNWKDVKWNPDPKGDRLVVARDEAGRVQSKYSEKFSGGNAGKKFSRVGELAQKREDVARQNAGNMRHKNPKIREAAQVLALILATGIRVGSGRETNAKVQSYGATTLLGRHVVVKGGKVSLQYTGKKGIQRNVPINDPRIAAELKKRKRASGPDGKLFKVAATSMRKYTDSLDGGAFTPHDFRTMMGTNIAAAEVAKLPKAKNEAEFKQISMGIAKKVAAQLGNTPTVALQSYIDPTVWAKIKP